MDVDESSGVGGECEVGAAASVTQDDGEGGEALEGARGSARGPVFGGVYWRVPVPIADVGVGAGGEEEGVEGGSTSVGGKVQSGPSAPVYVDDGVGVRDEGVSGRGNVVGANGARQGSLAAGVGQGRRKGDGERGVVGVGAAIE